MYNSPIEMIIGNMRMQQDGEIFRAVQEIGVNVDKDELLKALKYDRDQYDKGYNDGIRKFAKQHKEIMREFLYNDSTDFLMKWCEYETNTDNLLKEMIGDKNE